MRLVWPECCLSTAKVIQHHRHRKLVQHGLKGCKHREVGVNLHMPTEVFDARMCPQQLAGGHGRVMNAIGFEVDADSANASVVHGLQLSIAGLVIDHRHTAAAFAQRQQGVYRATVVTAVGAGVHDDHAFDAELVVQAQHVF